MDRATSAGLFLVMIGLIMMMPRPGEASVAQSARALSSARRSLSFTGNRRLLGLLPSGATGGNRDRHLLAGGLLEAFGRLSDTSASAAPAPASPASAPAAAAQSGPTSAAAPPPRTVAVDFPLAPATPAPPPPSAAPASQPAGQVAVVWPKGPADAVDPSLPSLVQAMALPTVPAPSPKSVIRVASDGSAQFSTIKAALKAAQSGTTISVKPGLYEEQVSVRRPHITLIGEGEGVIIRHDESAGSAGNLAGSATFSVEPEAVGFVARLITFENDHGPNDGPGDQALALAVYADMAAFYDCTMIGWQDTVYANEGRQYYKSCYIDGSVDYVFGDGVAVFEDCTLHTKMRPHNEDGVIIAHGRETISERGGFIIIGGRVSCDEGVEALLGRTWGSSARTVYAGTFMEGCVKPAGWGEMEGNERDDGTHFVEAACTGPGARREGRVPWCVEMNATEVLQFRAQVFLQPL